MMAARQGLPEEALCSEIGIPHMRLGADGSKSGLWAAGFVGNGNSDLEIFG